MLIFSYTSVSRMVVPFVSHKKIKNINLTVNLVLTLGLVLVML